jgi:hypothetical protein
MSFQHLTNFKMYAAPIADFVTTSLSGVLAAAATSATIGTGLSIPANNGILEISYDTSEAIGDTDGPETISYTSYNTSTGAISGLTRGLAGTTDVQHSSGQSVQSSVSSVHFSTDPSWANLNYTCTYASASTFTIAADVTSLIAIGDKIKLTQTTDKYFYVTAVSYGAPNTTVTVTGGTDYTLANAAITSPYYSKMTSPVGFPQWFNATAPTWVVATYDNGSGGQPTTSEYRFCIVGRTMRVHYRGNGTKAGSNSYLQFTATGLPVAPANSTDTTVLGSAYIAGSATQPATVTNITTETWLICTDSIADNDTLSNVSFNLNYEF